MSVTTPSRVIVDLKAYAYNLGLVKQMIPKDCQIMAVVKANAYGHGATAIAQAAAANGATMLGVASIDEGTELRQAGIDTPILVMLQPAEDCIPEVIKHDFRLMISDLATAEAIGEYARKVNKIVAVHCKVDTGMGRQGVDIGEALSVMHSMTRLSNIDIEGVATHFPVADSPNDPFTSGQVKLFKNLLKQLEKEGIPFEIAHAANSAAVVNHLNSTFNMVRVGLMAYGIWPTDAVGENSKLRPVLRWEAPVVMLRSLKAGSSIGYGRTYVTSEDMMAAILPVGYADGYKHAFSNKADVLIKGKRCPVRGKVSMDQIVVDVTQVPGVAPGDKATLIGSDGDDSISVEELAEMAQTVPYDILTGIGARVHRQYSD